MMHGVTLRYHNSIGAEISLKLEVIKKHLVKKFQVISTDRNTFYVLIILIYHAWVQTESNQDGAVLLPS